MATATNVHRTDDLPRELKPCTLDLCKKIIPRYKGITWKIYHGKKFCSRECAIAAKRGLVAVSEEDKNLAEYISKKTDNGKKLANFHLGVLKAFEQKKEKYKKLPLTPKAIQDSIEWLGKMGFGGIATREAPTVEKADNRTEEEKFTELNLLLGGLNNPGLRRSLIIDKADNQGQKDQSDS